MIDVCELRFVHLLIELQLLSQSMNSYLKETELKHLLFV
jgi:hypothetical protein